MATDPEAKRTTTLRHGDTVASVDLAEIQRLDLLVAELRAAAAELLDSLDDENQTGFGQRTFNAIDRLDELVPSPIALTPASNEILAQLDTPRRK